jgi:hypothetical protein
MVKLLIIGLSIAIPFGTTVLIGSLLWRRKKRKSQR